MNDPGLFWQAGAWQRLGAALAAGRLHHAVLIGGQPGVGKGALARRLAAAHLCPRATAAGGCGACPACRQVAAGSHPDFSLLEPEEPGKALPIDAVRGFAGQLALTSQYGHGKVGIVEPAEQMTVAAANGLLKTLEEPAPGTLLILVSAEPGRLLPTIRSRCLQVTVPAPEPEAALAWLAERLEEPAVAGEALAAARGGPLRALALAGEGALEARRRWHAAVVAVASGQADPVSAAADCTRDDVRRQLEWLQQWVADLARMAAGGAPRPGSAPEAELQPLRQTTNVERALALSGALARLRQGLVDTNPNAELLREEILTLLAGQDTRPGAS